MNISPFASIIAGCITKDDTQKVAVVRDVRESSRWISKIDLRDIVFREINFKQLLFCPIVFDLALTSYDRF